MLEKIQSIEEKYLELGAALEHVGDDYQLAAELAKERSELELIYQKAKEYRSVINQIEETRSLINEDDDDMRELAELDLKRLEPESERLEKELKVNACSK